LVENSRITCAAAVISPMVSFLTRRPVINAAVMTGESSPFMIMRMIFSISSWKISRCSMVLCSASWGVMGMAFSGFEFMKCWRDVQAGFVGFKP
jgi:hypothetical protein